LPGKTQEQNQRGKQDDGSQPVRQQAAGGRKVGNQQLWKEGNKGQPSGLQDWGAISPVLPTRPSQSDQQPGGKGKKKKHEN